MDKKKKIIIISTVAAAVAVVAVCVGIAVSSSQNKDDDTGSTNSTIIETVTNSNGEAVTDESGEAVTEIYEEVPVVDENGNVVKDENGQTVTQKVPATNPASGSGSASGSGGSTTKRPSSGGVAQVVQRQQNQIQAVRPGEALQDPIQQNRPAAAAPLQPANRKQQHPNPKQLLQSPPLPSR